MPIFSTSKSSQGSSSLQSAAIATLGGAQISLTLLEKMTDGVPLPFVKAAAGTAVEVIKLARAIQGNKEECEDLLKRIASLLVVILRSFDGKAESSIPEELRSRVERLVTTFHEVRATLETVEKRNGKRSALLYHFDNTDKLRGCSAELDWAIQEFQVMSQVNSCLQELERYAEWRDGQAEIRKDLNEIRDAVKEKKSANVPITLPSIVMPADPRIFGREEYIEKAVDLLHSQRSTRIAILGPGGMGKTSAALKIIYHARVVEKFGTCRYWVACEQATSVLLLIELLAKVLKIPKSTSSDRFDDVVAFLESMNVLVVFLFDNFETPWDIEGQRSDVGDVLARLASIPTVSIILTMRGNQCPYEESIDWSHPRLPSLTQLDLGAAEEAFIRISPNSAGDAELHPLLQELDCVPLAITLMAKLANGGESVHELVLQWKTERTRLLGQAGGDRRTSIEVSIKLSMDSPAVKANQDAITLLGILAMLPGGAAVSRLPDMCPSIPRWKAALRVLLGAALVYHNPDRSLIQVLSPIRSYMMLHHPLADTPLGDLRASYYKLAWKGVSEPGHSNFHANTKEIAMEETNMDAILLDALQGREEDKSKAILASMNYSNYLYWSQPRTNIIVAAIEVARIGQKPELADCLERLGRFVQLQGQYAAAQAIFKEAQAEYVRIADRLGVARCMESLGQNLLMQSQYDAAQTTLKEAQAEYVTLGNRLGAANCLFLIGQSLWMQAQYDAAQITLKEAQTEYISLGNRLGAANCLRLLGEILQMQTQYDAAQTTLKEAQAEYISLGNRWGAAESLQSLGVVYAAQLEYDASSTALMEAYAIYTTFGDRLRTAQCLYEMGRISRIRGSFTDATTRLEEARDLYSAFGNAAGAKWCSRQLLLASKKDSSA